MKNRQIPKSKPIPRWIDVFLKSKRTSVLEIAYFMNKRGCKINSSLVSKKSKIGYGDKFKKEELAILPLVKEDILKEVFDFYQVNKKCQ